ncbi:Deleted in lung and esophageal cancer protein 1 [Borealophlyctis nickersoniae]|nr:Deleted in lung and esophageal cancer protein 1 [Borealophlyctis nickersoniae]
MGVGRALSRPGSSRGAGKQDGDLSTEDVKYESILEPELESVDDVLSASIGDVVRLLRVAAKEEVRIKNMADGGKIGQTEGVEGRAKDKSGDGAQPPLGGSQNQNVSDADRLRDLLLSSETVSYEALQQVLLNDAGADSRSEDTSKRTIMDEYDRRIGQIHGLRDRIKSAKRRADLAERLRDEEAVKQFGPHYHDVGLPPVRVLLEADNKALRKNGLITCPSERDFLQEKDASDGKPKIRWNPPPLTQFQIHRTENAFKFSWFAKRDKVTEVLKPGVLEIDADIIAAAAAALEPSKEVPPVPVNSMHPFTDEELKIVERMKSRVAYLRNPRFPFSQPGSPEILTPERGFRYYGAMTSEDRWRMISTANYSVSVAPPTPRIISRNGIVAIPSAVMFTDYVPHQTYSKILTIKNATTTSHRFRLSTEAPYIYSSYFSFELVHSPERDGGLVAPGMSCRYRVSFTPDSLANFEQMLMVSTEVGDQFKVPVVARREPPVLTVPDILHCGPCRAGFVTARVWDYSNIGGPGRFLIMNEGSQAEPYEMFEKMQWGHTRRPVRQGPFEIFPSFFSLQAGAKGQLIVQYSPEKIEDEAVAERIDQAVVRIACDNLQILELPIVGVAQRPQVNICRLQLDDGSIVHKDDIHREDVFDLVLSYGAQNPQAMSLCLLTVKNDTLLHLPFKWVLFDNPGQGGQEEMDASLESVESIQVEPANGKLAPNTETTFEIIFSPETVKLYDVVARLVLLQDEKPVDMVQLHENEDTAEVDASDMGPALQIRCTGRGIPYDVTVRPSILSVPGTLYTGTSYTTRLRLTNNSVSRVACDWSIENVNENTLEIAMSETNCTIEPRSSISVEMRCTGYFPGAVDGALICRTAHGLGPELRVPLTATVDVYPNSLFFGTDLVDFGLIPLGGSKTVNVPLVNNSGVRMRWKVHGHKRTPTDADRDCYLMYEPSSGVIESGERVNISVTFVPVWYQSFRGILECDIVDDDSGRIPTLEWEDDEEERGERDLGGAQMERIVAITAVDVRAEVQTPHLVIINPLNNLTAYAKVPFRCSLLVRNATLLPASFVWKPVNNNDHQVVFRPAKGTLNGGKDIKIEVETTCFNGMVEHGGFVGAELNVVVKPMDVTFQIEWVPEGMSRTGSQSKPGSSSSSRPVRSASSVSSGGSRIGSATGRRSRLKFDFGSECHIFANTVRTLVIRNHSAVASPYRIWVEKFAATALDEEDSDSPTQADESVVGGSMTSGLNDGTQSAMSPYMSGPLGPAKSSGLLLSPTRAAKIGFSSNAGQEYISNIKEVRRLIQRMHRLLREGRGAAFHPFPSHGVLEPWAEVRITVTSYNNLVGLYEDNLVCEIGQWVREVIPIHMGVIGVPVKFTGAQLVASKKDVPDAADRVNFGTRLLHPGWRGGDGIRVGVSKGNRTGPETSHRQRSPDDGPEAFSKVIQVENQTPRDVVLHWKTFIKHTPIPSGGDDSSMRAAAAPPEVDDILVPENLLEDSALGIFGVAPSTLSIPAFRSASLRIFFRTAVVGAFDGLVVADIGYIQPDGSIMYAPRRGLNPIVQSSSSSKRQGAVPVNIKPSDLPSMARLHIQGKCTEPRLALDVGDHIRIKRSRRFAAALAQPGGGTRVVNVFLTNPSDAVCSFTMETIPSRKFTVVCAEAGAKPKAKPEALTLTLRGNKSQGGRERDGRSRLGTKESRKGMAKAGDLDFYELKPTEHMLIAVQYSPGSIPDDGGAEWELDMAGSGGLAGRMSTMDDPSQNPNHEPNADGPEVMGDRTEGGAGENAVHDLPGSSEASPHADEGSTSPNAAGNSTSRIDTAKSVATPGPTQSTPPPPESASKSQGRLEAPSLPVSSNSNATSTQRKSISFAPDVVGPSIPSTTPSKRFKSATSLSTVADEAAPEATVITEETHPSVPSSPQDAPTQPILTARETGSIDAAAVVENDQSQQEASGTSEPLASTSSPPSVSSTQPKVVDKGALVLTFSNGMKQSFQIIVDETP